MFYSYLKETLRVNSLDLKKIYSKATFIVFILDDESYLKKLDFLNDYININFSNLISALKKTKSKEKIISTDLDREYIFVLIEEEIDSFFFTEKTYVHSKRLLENNFDEIVIIAPEYSRFEKIFVSEKTFYINILEGVYLACYQNKIYKERIIKFPKVFINANSDIVEDLKKNLEAIIKSSFIAKDLVNASPEEIYPSSICRITKSLFQKEKFLKVKVIDWKKLQKEKLFGLIFVGKGSAKKPAMMILEKKTKNAKFNVVLIGKGITFDSGGISLKPSSGMSDMKADMSGAAAIIAAFFALKNKKLKFNLIGLLPFAENMPSGESYKPGDIIRYSNGITVEVEDTDAEGRLILADALIYANKYNPDVIIDLATLTGAAVVALGENIAALYSNDDLLSADLIQAGLETNELLWKMPLFERYCKALESQVADLKNYSGKWAGSITAALFLKKFVGKKVKWAHIDIAGPSFKNNFLSFSKDYMSGFGTKLIRQFLLNLNEKI